MRSLIMAAVFTLPLLDAIELRADDAADLKGEWQVIESTYQGETVPKEKSRIAKLVFDGKKLTITGDQRKKEFSYTLDATKEPKEMEMIMLDGAYKGKSNPAIFELKGEILRLCTSNDPNDPKRPSEFKSEKGSSTLLLILKRAK